MAASVTATQPDAAVALVQMALDHLESSFGPSLAGGFDVYAAGPPAMIDAVRHELPRQGADPARIFFDSFDWAPD
jgi:NAD(P)H-flavin reductase